MRPESGRTRITHASAVGKYGSAFPPVMCFHKKLPDSVHPMSGTEAAHTTKSSFIHEGGLFQGIQFKTSASQFINLYFKFVYNFRCQIAWINCPHVLGCLDSSTVSETAC
jgi:hypothetical protein